VVCAHATGFDWKLVCVEYVVYVLLYSSCRSFEKRKKGLPVVRKE